MLLKRDVFVILASSAVLAGIVGCGGGSDSPTVTPTPLPTTAPTPTPTPPPVALACDPTPPPLYGINVWVQQDSGSRKGLDSRPVVVNLDLYCQRTGQSGKFCFTRIEGDPQAEACDFMAVGKASDTGRYGPTWNWNGKPCTATEESLEGCRNHPTNQFLVIAKGEGEFWACAAPEIQLSQEPLPGNRCGLCRLVAGRSGCQ